ADDRARPGRRRMSNGVGDAEPRRAGLDGRREEPLQGIGIGPGGVFGDVHHRQVVPDGKRDRLLRAPLQILDGPVFRVAANRTRADEAADLDGNAGTLHDVGNRLDIADDGPGGAVRPDLQPALCDLTRQPPHIAPGMRAGARETAVGAIDAPLVEQVEHLNLLVDGRRTDGGRLQPVPQRLVVQRDDWRPGGGGVPIPVEDQRIIHVLIAFTIIRAVLLTEWKAWGAAKNLRTTSALRSTRGLSRSPAAPAGR